MGKAKRARHIHIPSNEVKCRDWLATAQIALLCIAAFISPIFAARMMAVPALAVQSIIFAAGVLWLMRSMKRCALGMPGGLIAPMVLVFAGLLLVSAFGSVSMHATVRELLNVYSYLLIFLMIADMRENRREPLLILGCLMVSAMIIGAIGMKEYILSYRSAGSNWRVFSTFFNPDYFAGFLVLVLPILLGWFLSTTSTSVSIISGVAGLLTLGALLLTGSRFGAAAGFLGVVICLILAGASGSLRKPQRVRLLLILIPGLIAAGAMAGPLIHKLGAAHGVLPSV
jgi:hypothetical protein